MSLRKAMLYLFPFLFSTENVKPFQLRSENSYGDMRPASYGSPEFYSNVRKFKGYMRENRRFNSFNKKKR